jgi:hypothetical protein
VDTNRIRYVYREVYFDRFGLWASMVARCGGPDRFFGIVDLIYEQQPEWTQGATREIAESLRRIGRTAGLTNEELDACLTDQTMAEALLASYEANTASARHQRHADLGHQRRDAQQHELRRSFRPSGRSARRVRNDARLRASAFSNWRVSWPAPGPVRRLPIWAHTSSRSKAPARRRHPPLGPPS